MCFKYSLIISVHSSKEKSIWFRLFQKTFLMRCSPEHLRSCNTLKFKGNLRAILRENYTLTGHWDNNRNILLEKTYSIPPGGALKQKKKSVFFPHYLQEKCAQYWSSDGVMVCGDMSIELKREEESESYTVRDLLVTNNRVSSLQRISWNKKWFVIYVCVLILSLYFNVCRFLSLRRKISLALWGSFISTAGQRWASPPTGRAWSTSSPQFRNSSSSLETTQSLCTAGKPHFSSGQSEALHFILYCLY